MKMNDKFILYELFIYLRKIQVSDSGLLSVLFIRVFVSVNLLGAWRHKMVMIRSYGIFQSCH